MPKQKTISLIILILIILSAAFLRLYRIGDYMAFLGDEGRDVLIVKRMIVDGKLTLLGPITSVGLMHLGPAYYYFMAPFLWLFQLDPVGPAVMVALFSLATVFLIWKMGREFFDERIGTIAALLYAISPLVIIHSHSSWNPNILPFWGLLIIYSLAKVMVKQQYLWVIGVGAALGISLQLHYISLVYIPIIGICIWINRKNLSWKFYIFGFAAALITYSPFIIFELRHDFLNTQTVAKFITRGGDAKTFGIMTFFARFWDLTIRLVWRLITVQSAELTKIYLLAMITSIIVLLKKLPSSSSFRQMLIILLVWYFGGIGLLSFYTGSIYDYYLMFAFPLPFFLTGIVLSTAMKQRMTKIIAIIFLSVLVFYQLKATPILKSPNRLAVQSKEITTFILEKTEGKPFNFALIAQGNSDHAYRYFLEIGGNAPVVIKNEVEDPERTSVTGQLIVVCEEKVCQPLGHPLWEIAGFGRAEVTDEWTVGFFKVFKLVKYNNPL